MRVEEFVEKSARVMVRDVHVVLAVSKKYGDVDILDLRQGVKLVTEECLDEFCKFEMNALTSLDQPSTKVCK